MQLIILRHAETWANLEGRMQGRYNLDLQSHQCCELTPRGRYQAIALGNRLAHHFQPPTQVHLSPLQRVQETWKTLPSKPTCAISFDPLLSEIDQGILSGLTWAEAEIKHPVLCKELLSQPEWLPIPGAESPTEARTRAELFLHELYQNSTDSDHVWIMTHGGFIPHLVSALLGSNHTWGISVSLTALFEFSFSWSRNGKKEGELYNPTLQEIKFFNDVSHQTVSNLSSIHQETK